MLFLMRLQLKFDVVKKKPAQEEVDDNDEAV